MLKYRKKIASSVDMENLPGDILSNIFIHLLAKQLAQMRCVCKSWNDLISEPKFVKSHLHRSIHNKDDILLFFKNLGTFDSSPGPSAARASRSPNLELTDFMKLKLPVDPQHKNAFGKVIGSVNGLICFVYRSDQDDLGIRIWNPSLSALLTLPAPYLSHKASQFGFIFDPKDDDYKVVRLECFFQELNMVSKPQAEVYSMRKGSWEPISERIPSRIKEFNGPYEVCVDGCLHLICSTNLKKKPDTILTFDLGEMTYGVIPLPDPVIDSSIVCRNSLGVLSGKLCVMSINDQCKCDVWVMDDGESWVKQHVFSQFKYYITPYGFTSRGEFLFQINDGYRFALYDLVADNTKAFKIKWTQQFERYNIVEYVDSLVWIAPPTHFKLAA